MKSSWLPEELQAMKPPEKLTISEWACKYRELGRLSAVTGLYPLHLAPFWGPIMDRCCHTGIDQVVVCGPAQIGKTVAVVENVIGYYTHQDPSSMLVVLADEQTAAFISEEKIAPMFKDSSALSQLYDPKTFNKTEVNTKGGARIDFAWASSVAKLATKPVRIVVCDEVDKPGYSMKSKEAGSLSLAKERTASYPSGYFKHIFCSTPTDAEGNIFTLLDQSDIIFDWHVPCPYCGFFQPLRWSPDQAHGFTEGKYRGDDGELHSLGGVMWDGGREATPGQVSAAGYKCGECGRLWDSQQKNEAVRRGKEVPRTKSTGRERKTGHHINRLYSLFDSGKLEKIVANWISCFKMKGQQHVKHLQGFVNSTLAEPFKLVVRQSADSVDRILSAKCDLPPQTVPEDAIALTCFVDVQKHGFYFVVRAWAQDYTSWNIHYGDLARWDDVEKLLFETAYPVLGTANRMRIWRAAVDTGGGEKYQNMSMTEETYFWLRKNGHGRGCRVWGTKGSNVAIPSVVKVMKPIDSAPSGRKIVGGLQIVRLDTFALKDRFIHRLDNAIENEPFQAAYLHSDTGDDYAKHIMAEEKQSDEKGGQAWVQVKTRNDFFDCEAGNMALAFPEWPGGGVHALAGRPDQPPKGRRILHKGARDIWGE